MDASKLIEKMRYVVVGSYLLSSVSGAMFLALGIVLLNFRETYYFVKTGEIVSLNYPRVFLIVGTPIFSIMFDAIVIIGMEIMIRRIYALNVIKSTAVILAVISILFLLNGPAPDPLDLENRPFVIGLASAMIGFNAFAMGISLWMRKLEEKLV
ncbi:hypothetical protein IC006_0710 [Sulfuracidifex tepidarius]|uniref:Uncharacterized protein n=1 Tax=Sulfuracidifex tepidarius TaxID=1294262 RepID=A0A510DT88_9CREN|nr:hypothetical protein [Sulfuracidifex tepidarius]BBG23426.1 hypothetical protein IC006_0710 [Sulfuracidifex tepidarius]